MWTILRQVRKHPDVVPVFVITLLGASFGTVALLRSSLYYTDVSFKRKTNPHPWLHVGPNQQTKFIHAHDYSKIEMKRPNYKDQSS